jgi:Icc-related predicted phosphoesterase
MRLLCITDLHGDASALDRIVAEADDVDVVLLGGDITHFGTPNAAEDFVRHVQRRAPKVFAVAGNCDSQRIDERLAEIGVSLFGRGVVYQGVGFYGVSAMPPWLGNMYELTEAEIAAALSAGKQQLPPTAGPEVVLSHPPPHGSLVDLTRRGEHVGSLSVRAFVDQVQPALVVCGHIHEGRGIDTLGATTVVNCGPAYQGYYAVAEVGEAVRVELRGIPIKASPR